MAIILSALKGMAARMLTAAIIERIVIWGLEELVKSTRSKADDELLKIIKEGLNHAD